MHYHFSYLKFPDLPHNWNEIVGSNNRLLSTQYFRALEQSLPNNMNLEYIAYYDDNQSLIGGALIQKLNFIKHNTFNRDKGKNCGIKNITIRNIANPIAILGNNMLSGQNGFYFDLTQIDKKKSLQLLLASTNALSQHLKKNRLTVLKDYSSSIMDLFDPKDLKNYTAFEVQPTMIFKVKNQWQSFEQYYESMNKKYRARLRTARKKFGDFQKKTLEMKDLSELQDQMYLLYKNVADKATFNTFFLAPHHFYELKKYLAEHFHVIGYFDKQGELVGFFSIIENYSELDTYFLGYDETQQKPRQLYLNMLLDMVQMGIDEQVEKINFGRTALEIKSTVGAKPQKLYGFLKHSFNPINTLMPAIFNQINPEKNFVERNPFT